MPYRLNDHYVTCDICGFKKLRSQCRKTWDNLIVCADTCYDGPRNPQDYLVHPKSEKIRVSDPRPKEKIKATVITGEMESIASTSAICAGSDVRHEGGTDVFDKGVCWSTSTAPTTDDDADSYGTGTGEYDCELTALSPSTRYFVRAYAINNVGTAYGQTVEFTTAAV